MLENEQVNSDVESAVPSEPQTQPDQSRETPSQEAAPKQETTPFHEHPRWKEMIEQRNQAQEQARQLQQQYADMQRQFHELRQPKPEAPQDKTYEKLKGIDPEFADYIKDIREQAMSAKEVREQLQQIQTQNFVREAVSTVNSLHAENKVPAELKKIYEEAIDARYATGKLRSVEDVKKAYSEIHSQYSQVLESVRRAERESYTASKKSESSTPTSQAKGNPVNHSSKAEYSKDPAEARSQLVKRIISQTRAEKEL
jgi:hypothetical protein